MSKENPPPYSAPYSAPAPGFVQPQAMPQPQPQHTTHVVITERVHLGPSSQPMRCPSCHQNITSTVSVEPNTKTHLFALLLFALGCWICCCIPYCTDSCQSTKHNCPSCGAYLGEYQN